MKKNIFTMLVLSLLASGYLWAANNSHPVEVDGDRISVQADGIPLGELLLAIKNLTGIHFGFDELMAKRETFVDFKDLSLSEGIKKIVFPLSCAMIYDETDKLRKVVILGRGKDSGTRERREVENRASESSQFGSLHTVPFTPQGGSDVSIRSKAHPSAKGPLQFYDTPTYKKKAEDGPPARQEVVMEGPPLNEPYSMDGPTEAQNGELTGQPDAESSDPSLTPDSGGSLVDSPPLDWKYEMDGPPD